MRGGHRHGPLRYSVDRYDDAGLSWQANLRAVVLTLEALRAVERYRAATADPAARRPERSGRGQSRPG